LLLLNEKSNILNVKLTNFYNYLKNELEEKSTTTTTTTTTSTTNTPATTKSSYSGNQNSFFRNSKRSFNLSKTKMKSFGKNNRRNKSLIVSAENSGIIVDSSCSDDDSYHETSNLKYTSNSSKTGLDINSKSKSIIKLSK
jgi:hypothetical protein